MTRKVARILVFLRKIRRKIGRYDALRVWIFAAIVGAAAAYAVILFRMAIDAVSNIAFGATEETLLSSASSLDFGRAWAAPVIGGLAVSAALYLFGKMGWLKDSRAQGIADVIEGRAINSGRVSIRAGLSSAIVSALSLGSGASAGREGPAVHLGAAIASFLDRHMGFTPQQRRTLLGCGAAAAVSASFNAPIAGVLFALEVILGNYALSVFGPIAAASVSAAIVTRIHLGDFPAFAPPEYGLIQVGDVPLAAILGLMCGLMASLFILSTERLSDGATAIAKKYGVSPLWLPPIGGLFIGFVGATHPEIFGVGYEAVTNALAGQYSIFLLLLLVGLKGITTAVTLACRFGGGVFAPGLVLGAFAGAAYGGIIGFIAPGSVASPVFYAMIGMGAAGGAILGAPISTTLIVFELTGEYGITLSLMVAVALATLVTQWICGKSFFHWQLANRGYDLSEGPQGVILKTIRVRDVMDRAHPGDSTLEAGAPRLKAGQTLGEALAALTSAEEFGLPVVDPSAPDVAIGYLSRVSALAAYNRELIRENIEHHT